MNDHSAPSPLRQARNSTLYYYNGIPHLPDLTRHVWPNNINTSILSPECDTVLRVCVLYMARIGEILSLKIKHIVNPDRVICYGSKRSNGYLLYLPGLTSQVSKWSGIDKEINLFGISYMKVYRQCGKAGILLNDGQGGNTKKCHAHRYLFARSQINSKGREGVKIALHHKSVKSQESYLNKEEKVEKIVACQTALDFGHSHAVKNNNLLAPYYKVES